MPPAALMVLLFAAVLGWSPIQMSVIVIVFVLMWMVGGVCGAAAVRREPAREHPPASRRFRARVDAGDGSRHQVADHVAAQGHAEGDCLRAQPVRARARSQGPSGGARPAASRGCRRSASRRSGCWRAPATPASRTQIEELVKDPDLGVRTEALLYLTEFDPTDPLQRIEALGDFEDFSIQAAIVAFLARPGRSQNIDAAKLLLSKMVEEPGEDRPTGAARSGAVAVGPARRRSIASCARSSMTRTSRSRKPRSWPSARSRSAR